MGIIGVIYGVIAQTFYYEVFVPTLVIGCAIAIATFNWGAWWNDRPWKKKE